MPDKVIHKSLGDYNIEQSSSADIKNIKWSQKNPKDAEIKKKNRKRKISPLNIIYTEKIKPSVKKIFRIKEDIEKTKKKKTDKKFQKSSADNCNIQQGFKRPGR